MNMVIWYVHLRKLCKTSPNFHHLASSPLSLWSKTLRFWCGRWNPSFTNITQNHWVDKDLCNQRSNWVKQPTDDFLQFQEQCSGGRESTPQGRTLGTCWYCTIELTVDSWWEQLGVPMRCRDSRCQGWTNKSRSRRLQDLCPGQSPFRRTGPAGWQPRGAGPAVGWCDLATGVALPRSAHHI